MSYENKRDKLKKELRNQRPKVNRKKYFKAKRERQEHSQEMNFYISYYAQYTKGDF